MSIPAVSEIDRLFTSAREGSNSCLGRLLTLYSNYLKLLVAAQLDNRLKARVSASDIVQEAFFEAHRDFNQFRGESTAEFVAWLRKIVVNNILRAVEQHVLAEKRDVRREISLDEVGRRLEQSTVRLETLLAVKCDSPSCHAASAKTKFNWPMPWRTCRPITATSSCCGTSKGLPFEEVAVRMEPVIRGGANAVAAGIE